MMVFAVTKVRLDGCLFGPPSERDYRTVFQDRTVPDRVDLRQYCTRVEDQGQIGSCTANAAVGALEYHHKRRDGRSPDLSRMFVYFNTRRMRGQVVFDTGAQIREAMASLMAFGACREEIWPYDPMLRCTRRSSTPA
jgi:C1A family cysteine protease